MARLPVVSGMHAAKAFARAGWTPVRQTGSHLILEKEGSAAILSIPLRPALKRGLLRQAIRDAGLTVEEFRRLL